MTSSTVLMSRTMALYSWGVMEKEASGFSISRLMQKCFSTIFAPSATAVTALTNPREWSDRPTGNPKRFFMSCMVDRCICAGSAG